MRHPRRGRLSCGALLLALSLAGLPAASPARAQANGEASLQLVSMPVWHEVDDKLGLKVKVVNQREAPLEGFRLVVGAGSRLTSRSALHQSFEEPFSLNSFPLEFATVVPPGEGRTVTVKSSVGDLTAALGGLSGVYPLTVSLVDLGTGTPLDGFTTQLLLFGDEPITPLGLVPLVPLNHLPYRGPDGIYRPDAGGRTLGGALSERGWIASLLTGLAAATAPPPEPEPEPEGKKRGRRGRRARPKPEPEPVEPLHVAFAPTPRMIEDIAEMTDGFRAEIEGETTSVEEDAEEARSARALLEKLTGMVARDTVQTVLVPYAFPDLPALDEQGLGSDVAVQLTEGIRILGDSLDLEVDRDWVYPPAGRLDAPALEALQSFGVTGGTFFSSESLEEPPNPAAAGCPVVALSFACAVRVSTTLGEPIDGFAFDPELQARLTEMSDAGHGRTEMQRFFAETAMIHLEQPAADGRVIQATIPSAWHPSPRAAGTFFDGLRGAPWLQTMTAEEGVAHSTDAPKRPIVDDVGALPRQPEPTFFTDILEAQDLIESFESFVPEEGPVEKLQRLRRNLLVAEGRTWWGGTDLANLERARSYVTDSVAEATAEMAKVRVAVASQTTFTSRKGSIQISIFNDADYPVEATVVLESLDMEFRPEVIEGPFEPGNDRRQIDAEAKTSGSFPIEVRVEAGDHTIATASMQVRSTEFNQFALALTLGAVAFLVLFYVVRVARRKRRRGEDAAEVPSS